ncbi:indole-3-glycerol phosphate synthase TrpC [Bacillaceae bacterium]
MLHKIVERKRQTVAQLKAKYSLEALREATSPLPPARSLAQSVKGRMRDVAVIAEVKKASPSKGVIREDFSPLAIADAYERAAVEGISVLTDEPFFQGKNEYLTEIKERVSCPVLRKDFIIDPIQIYEARLIGADCILLIAAILSAEELAAFHRLAKELTLDTLIEVHTEEELALVLESVPDLDLLGINNRDLKTFVTSLETTERLLPSIPRGIPVISESGISRREDIAALAAWGVAGVLVGEHFMRQRDPEQAVYDLVGPIPAGRRSP